MRLTQEQYRSYLRILLRRAMVSISKNIATTCASMDSHGTLTCTINFTNVCGDKEIQATESLSIEYSPEKPLINALQEHLETKILTKKNC